MLKHRYGSLSESISDFDRMLDGMNGVQPLERHSVDEDVLAMFREEQELVRLERQIEHLHRAVYGSGMPISEAESAGIRAIHAHAAATYESAAEKLMAHVRARTAELEKVADASREKFKAKLAGMQKVHDTFRRKAEEHRSLASPLSSERKIVNDSVNESVGRRATSGISVFRRLAGIEETVQMPRDPGVLGTTRFNAEYEKMAQPFDEGGDWNSTKIAAHKTKMRGVAKDIHGVGGSIDKEYAKGGSGEAPDHVKRMKAAAQAAHKAGSTIDREYKEGVATAEPFAVRPSPKGAHEHDGPKMKDSGEKTRLKKSVDFLKGHKVDEAKKWAGDAVKRPGRLHKYFGIPEDQKIPMSKIKAAYNKLKDKEDKSAEETSLMRALALGIRFKGGDVPGGEAKRGLAGEDDEVAESRPKASADRLDREHEEGLASNIADKTRNAIRWTQGASPVERRLAKAQDAVARAEKTAKKLDKIKVSNESQTIEDRIREIREGRPKAMQIKGQELMMKRSFPKRHAQWTKDKEAIVASGRKVSDDERATPRFLNQRADRVKDDPENDRP